MAQFYIGDQIRAYYNELATLTGFISGAQATTWDSGHRIYLFNGTTWEPTYGSAQNSGFTTEYREIYLTTGNMPSGSVLTIPNSRTYPLGTNFLNVFVEGVLQQKCNSGLDNDYVENSTSSVYFAYAIASGVSLTYQIFAK